MTAEGTTEAILKQIRIVLVGTTHAGNIGAVARAMKTMGLSQLALHQSKANHLDEQAIARACGAVDVLRAAQRSDCLTDSLGDCGFIVGTSSRSRALSVPCLTPRVLAQTLIEQAQKQPVAVVFGAERSGLTNAQLQHCHALCEIPANPEYCSLNLASAVQLISYELRLAALEHQPVVAAQSSDRLANHDELSQFYAHLEQVLIDIGFLNPDAPKKLMVRLRRLFQRAQLEALEVNLLRGVLQKAAEQQSER